MTMQTSSRIAFLAKTFPKLSETFILGEVLGLEARGLPLVIFALQESGESLRHTATERVRSPIVQLRRRNQSAAATKWSEHWLLIRTQPLRYLATAVACFRRNEPQRWRDFSLACSLATRLQLWAIRHIHAHFASQPAAVAELASQLTGATFSVSAHAKDIYTADPDTLGRRLAKAQFTVTCTKHNVDYLRAIAPSDTRLHLMYHGIDFVSFSAHQRKPTDAPLILSVGRLKEKKGFATLIESCSLLRKRGVEFRCEIIGYGEEQTRLAALIQKLQLQSQVSLSGPMSHAEVIERYQAATIFAAPSLVTPDGDRDGIPNVLLEAMAMALPVVTTSISGIPEVVKHGSNGMLVPPGRPEEMANCLQLLLRDPALRQHLGSAARNIVVERFDNQHNLDTVHRLLLDATHRFAEPTENLHAEHNCRA